MSEELEKEENTEKKSNKKKAPKPAAPAIYTEGEICMHSKMITTESDFFRIWSGKTKKTDLAKAWKKARAWRDKYK